MPYAQSPVVDRGLGFFCKRSYSTASTQLLLFLVLQLYAVLFCQLMDTGDDLHVLLLGALVLSHGHAVAAAAEGIRSR